MFDVLEMMSIVFVSKADETDATDGGYLNVLVGDIVSFTGCIQNFIQHKVCCYGCGDGCDWSVFLFCVTVQKLSC